MKTRRFNRPQATDAAISVREYRRVTSLCLIGSTCPRSFGNGGTEVWIGASFGLITGVLQRGQRSRESSSFTPQLTQYDIFAPFLPFAVLKEWLSDTGGGTEGRLNLPGKHGCFLFLHEFHPPPACGKTGAPHPLRQCSSQS